MSLDPESLIGIKSAVLRAAALTANKWKWRMAADRGW